MDSNTRILFVHGMKPKPPAELHEATLWRCLLNGIERNDAELARQLAPRRSMFSLVPWAPLFYDEQTEIEPDLPGVDRLLSLAGPEPEDIDEASHWHKRVGRLVYLLCDAFPFLIDLVASDDLKETLHDALRYFDNENGVATRIRARIENELTRHAATGSRILLIGHSLGSVIAFDVLFELSRRKQSDVRIDEFMTLGSPLGLNFMRHRMLNADVRGIERYPDNINRWTNLAAIGDMTSLDRSMADDYRAMLKHGLTRNIIDESRLQTYFRGPDGLNVHRCYGYMANELTGAEIARWLQRG